MLREEVIPNIKDKLGEEEFSKMWFQQDGVRPHCTRAAMDYLHSVSSYKLITLNSARVGGTDWPLTSPDLSTLDYHTWKAIQEKLYFGPNPPHDLVSLKSCELDWSSVSSSHSRAQNIRQRASQPAGQTAPHPPVYLPVAVMFFSEAVNSLPTSAAILEFVSSSRYWPQGLSLAWCSWTGVAWGRSRWWLWCRLGSRDNSCFVSGTQTPPSPPTPAGLTWAWPKW